MKPHKHAEIIKAWADGAIIQWVGAVKHGGEKVWMDIENPDWCSNEYRIKPEPKPNFYKLYLVFTNRIYSEGERFPISGFNKPNLKLCFDGETGELKSAEVLK